MAKKKEEQDQTTYIPALLEDVMGDRFSRYAKYIIQERALPDARDGLKPVQRRILYAMYHDGNTWDHPYRKSAKTVGLVIGNYHPHGDTSVYDAMVRMSQDWKVRLPLIDMHGNNGSIDDDPAAAMRYTEVRLAKVTQIMEDDLDKDTVEMTPNFDDTENEPTVLPVPFPVLLVNGATGIAAGYATNMPPHNLGEVVDACIYRLQNPHCSLEEVMEYIPGPDFPTGGIVQGRQGILDAFTTGHGRVVVRARAEIVQGRTNKQIVITEIPYEVIKSDLVRQMDEIRIDKEIDGILAVRDESGREGLRIVVDVRSDADAGMILNYFYKNTDLQIYYSYNNVCIIDRQPVEVGLLGLLDAFIDFRKEVVTRRARYELNRMDARCHVIEGLMKAVSILDQVIAVIRASKDKADAKNNLMQEFGFDEPQAEAIVTLRLYRLSNTDITQLRNEFAELVNKMEETRSILENPKVLRYTITQELRQVRKDYADPRRTTIEEEVSDLTIDKASMVASEQVVITVSRDGYLKRVSQRSYQASEGKPTGLKEGDQLLGHLACDTLDTLLLFTSQGNYAYLPVWQMEEAKWKDLGSHLNKLVSISGEDKIIDAVVIHDLQTAAWIVTVSSDGMIKKTRAADWAVQRNRRVLPAMSLKPGAQLVRAFAAYAGDQVLLVSRNGRALHYSLDQVPETGVKTRGVKAINLAEGDTLADGIRYKSEGEAVLFVCTNGAMKRVRREEIPELNRPGAGSYIAKRVKSNPSQIRFARQVHPQDILSFYDPEEQLLKASEVPLKSTDTTFSSPLVLKTGWYCLRGIQNCLDKEDEEPAQTEPAEEEEISHDVERLSLFTEGEDSDDGTL